jgi:hypothetical protein
MLFINLSSNPYLHIYLITLLTYQCYHTLLIPTLHINQLSVYPYLTIYFINLSYYDYY